MHNLFSWNYFSLLTLSKNVSYWVFELLHERLNRDKMTFIAKKNHLVCMRGKIMAETSKGMPAENRACLPDRSFDTLYTGSAVEWMTYAVSRGCAKCHLLADSITGVLIMSLNECFQFQQLHIPHQQYLQTIAFDSLRMRIAHCSDSGCVFFRHENHSNNNNWNNFI